MVRLPHNRGGAKPFPFHEWSSDQENKMKFGLKCWLAAALLAMTPMVTPNAPTNDLAAQEYVPGAGYVAEDEWYDPSDWFDGNDVEIEDYYEGDADAYADYDEVYDDDYVDDYYDYDYDDDYYYDDDSLYDDYYYGLDDGYDFDDYWDGYEEGYEEGYYDNYYTSDWYDDDVVFDDWYDAY